ncbi:LUD domain-containing protein [Streptomyces scopuliridis]|uniref:LUD domain-containing protein n=1 Tax=Streptomyces scopuliridis TaxID=452529 RepID=A0ACD4ZY70_9ACTN|nr:LUD domain-containing protein [Streptomyces scopuliridis]WSB37370.1 LUD domain-containing protein [Streptomyces scopuliridis]WSC01987.1 LUD domain-containing protein [Streptomyces scopuliridis]WSC04476.1 LUD domain-containing protein [Streptomyces scopuliridis]
MSTGAGAASGTGTGKGGGTTGTGTSGGSRERILARIRAAVADAPDAPEAARDYLETHTPDERVIDLLAENLADYRALVHRTDSEGLPTLIARLLAERGARTVLVPPLLPAFWLSALSSVGTDLIRVEDDPTATARELDVVDSVITGCALAIAETGTLVLDAAPDQGRRRITLVPDHHICVVRTADQVVGSVPQAMPLLDPTRPLTWISGPSATSDIELDRVEGVHGPRTLEVILLTE